MLRLAFDDFGQGPAVVLLHGFPLNRSMWSGQLRSLGEGVRVVAPDLRGFGETPIPQGTESVSMEEYALDVLGMMDALGLREPVVLGGHSMGGYVALAAVALRPERFRGLMLIDTRAAADTPEAAANRLKLARDVQEPGDVRPLVEGMLPRLFSARTRERHPEVTAPMVEGMLKTTPAAVAAALRGMAARPDRTAGLASIAVPTLVIVGEHDVISTPEESKEIAQGVQRGRCVVIPDAGHMAPVENPDACNAAIREYLTDLG